MKFSALLCALALPFTFANPIPIEKQNEKQLQRRQNIGTIAVAAAGAVCVAGMACYTGYKQRELDRQKHKDTMDLEKQKLAHDKNKHKQTQAMDKKKLALDHKKHNESKTKNN
jgi:hypothetical protein